MTNNPTAALTCVIEQVCIDGEWPGGISDGLVTPCQFCGDVPKFDYGVTDEFWNEVVTDNLKRGVICLPCFDVICAAIGADLAENLIQIQFTGHGKTIVLRPESVYYYEK